MRLVVCIAITRSPKRCLSDASWLSHTRVPCLNDAGLFPELGCCALYDRFIVAAMALVGITTALLVNMLGQARIWTMAAREHMIPGFWAKVSPRFGTPIAAQITMGAASGVVPLATLSCLVSLMPGQKMRIW